MPTLISYESWSSFHGNFQALCFLTYFSIDSLSNEQRQTQYRNRESQLQIELYGVGSEHQHKHVASGGSTENIWPGQAGHLENLLPTMVTLRAILGHGCSFQQCYH